MHRCNLRGDNFYFNRDRAKGGYEPKIIHTQACTQCELRANKEIENKGAHHIQQMQM